MKFIRILLISAGVALILIALTGTALRLKDRADTKNASLRMTILPEARSPGQYTESRNTSFPVTRPQVYEFTPSAAIRKRATRHWGLYSSSDCQLSIFTGTREDPANHICGLETGDFDALWRRRHFRHNFDRLHCLNHRREGSLFLKPPAVDRHRLQLGSGRPLYPSGPKRAGQVRSFPLLPRNWKRALWSG